MKIVATLLGLLAPTVTLAYLLLGDVNKTWRMLTTIHDTGFCMVHRWQRPELPQHQPSSLGLSLRIDAVILPIGESLKLSYYARQDGYVSLWNVGTSGQVKRIYPASGSKPLVADQWYRSGEFLPDLKAMPPVGADAVALSWTREPLSDGSLQGRYNSPTAFKQALENLSYLDAEWVLALADFCIYQP